MHDNNVRHVGSVGVDIGCSQPQLLLESATSFCTGDDITCALASTAISGDAVEGGVQGYLQYRNAQNVSTCVRSLEVNQHVCTCGLNDVINEPGTNVALAQD